MPAYEKTRLLLRGSTRLSVTDRANWEGDRSRPYLADVCQRSSVLPNQVKLVGRENSRLETRIKEAIELMKEDGFLLRVLDQERHQNASQPIYGPRSAGLQCSQDAAIVIKSDTNAARFYDNKEGGEGKFVHCGASISKKETQLRLGGSSFLNPTFAETLKD